MIKYRKELAEAWALAEIMDDCNRYANTAAEQMEKQQKILAEDPADEWAQEQLAKASAMIKAYEAIMARLS